MSSSDATLLEATRQQAQASHSRRDNTNDNLSWQTTSSSGKTSSSERTRPHTTHGKLSTATFAVMVFYSVSGGPFGMEATVRAAGNFFALLGFLVFPFIWSVQEAMMTAELASAFPEASGGVAWVEEAFGTQAGWMTGYLGWVAGATDNAIYPVLFLDYLLAMVATGDEELNPGVRFVCLASTTMVLAYINWRGLALVGNLSLVICFIAMTPFVLLVVIGASKVDPGRWFTMPSRDYDDVTGSGRGILPSYFGPIAMRVYLNNLFWNLNSFDAAASFVEDIDTPGRTMPVGMTWAVVMVSVGYLLPLLIALGASDSSQEDWVYGYMARAVSDIIGPWLGVFTVFAAGINNIALFQTHLSADAYQLMGMADRGHVPKIFGERSRYGTPTYCILLGTLIIVLLSSSKLDRLVEMLNFNYAIALLLEYSAFIKLRVSRPEIVRPFRVPFGTRGCVLGLVPTVMFTCLVLLLADWTTYLFSISVSVVGLFIYRVMRINSVGLGNDLIDLRGSHENVLDDTFIAAAASAKLDGFEATTLFHAHGSELL